MKRAPRLIIGAAALCALVFVAYLRVWHAGFIWDDDAHLTQNPCIIGPLGFQQIWTTAEATYYPLVLTTFWLVHKIAGVNAQVYHVLNVLLHAANAILLWRVLRALHVRAAWLGAALWALHPVMVQSVAWITETKNTQSCFFYLLSVLFFVKWNTARRWWQFALALLFGAAAITSKSSTVVLPAVLALCLWWENGRWRWRDILALIPFALLSAIASAWTIWEQKFHSGAVGDEWAQTAAQRTIIAGRDICFYVAKLAWPDPLVFIYPRWQVDASLWLNYMPVAAVAAALIALWVGRNTRARAVLFAAAYFLIALLPVLGFFDVYFFRYSFVSDHFQYLASIGPLALAASAMTTSAHSLPASRFTIPAAGAFLLALLGWLTWRQTGIYMDAETLWTATLARNPQCWMAHYELARSFRDQGNFDDAVREYRQGLAIWPGYSEAHYNLASVLLQKGDLDGAIGEYETAVRLKPHDAETHNNLGSSLLLRHDLDRAITEFLTALALNPNYAEAEQNVGSALLQRGRTEQGIQHLRRAVELGPQNAGAHGRLGTALARAGRETDATVELQRAIELDPRDVTARATLAWILATSADPAVQNGGRAVTVAEEAAQLSAARDPLSLRSLAAAYAKVGRFSEARDVAHSALLLAEAQQDRTLADAIRNDLALYELDLPYRGHAK